MKYTLYIAARCFFATAVFYLFFVWVSADWFWLKTLSVAEGRQAILMRVWVGFFFLAVAFSGIAAISNRHRK